MNFWHVPGAPWFPIRQEPRVWVTGDMVGVMWPGQNPQSKKGNYDGLDKQATWIRVGRLDREGMIRLDKGVMGITKKGNFDGLHNIPKKEGAQYGAGGDFLKKKFSKKEMWTHNSKKKIT